MSIIEDAKKFLNEHKGFWKLISFHSGVSYIWILKFMAGDIDNPGVKTLEAILELIDSEESQRVLAVSADIREIREEINTLKRIREARKNRKITRKQRIILRGRKPKIQ